MIVLQSLESSNLSICISKDQLFGWAVQHCRKQYPYQKQAKIIKNALKDKSKTWDEVLTTPELKSGINIEDLYLFIIHMTIGKSMLSFWDHSLNTYIPALEYYGEGLQSGRLCGLGGIKWLYNGKEVYESHLWIS